MVNPFKVPLFAAKPALPQGSGAGGHYNFPSQVDIGNGVLVNNPVAPPPAFGPYTDVDSVIIPNYSNNIFQDTAPDYAGQYGVGFADTRGPLPSHSYSIIAGPGDVDVSVPRDVGSVSAPNRSVRVMGPVSGDGTNYTGLIAKLKTINPNTDGPVTGGEDYSVKLSASYWASQQATFSQAAAAQALISAV